MTRRKSRSASKSDKPNFFHPITIGSVSTLLSDERFRKITGLFFLLIVAPYLLISFSSYLFTWSSDMSLVRDQGFSLLFNKDVKVDNWLGALGAVVSHKFIYSWFGITSYLFVLNSFLIGVKLVFGISLLPVKKIMKHSFFILIWLSITLGYFFNTLATDSVYHLMGGAFGIMSDRWLQGALGNIGTGIFLVFTFFTYLIIAFNVSFNWFGKPGVKEGEKEEEDDTMAKTMTGAGIELGVDAEEKPEEKEKSEESTEEEEESAENGEGKESLELEINTEPDENTPVAAETESTEDGDLELQIEEVEDEEVLPADQIKDEQELINYDPTLDLASFEFPSVDLLLDHDGSEIEIDKSELERNKDRIVDTLRNFNIEIERIKATVGPSVTLYEIVPAAGIKISKIRNLNDDIALSLSALGIRIIAPIPGKGTVGIEVPNLKPKTVSIRSIIASEKFQNSEAALPIGLGKTITNEILIADLTKMPHLLLAGATGQGKSVGLNAILVSLLYKKHPSEVKFILIDPKIVELSLYKKIEKHYLAKLPDTEDAIISDTKKVVFTLNSLCIEMEDRYKLLQDAQVRELSRYNEKFVDRKLNPKNGHRYLPYLVVVIDEFADLIMTAGKEIENPLGRLAQKARAIGIHLIIATQRPSVNIITGTIKANFPVRIAFRVTSKIDSTTILDRPGAEQLVGRGDMLFSNGNDLIRLQGAFVDTPEVEAVVNYIETQQGYPHAFALPEYVDDSDGGGGVGDDGDRDVLFEEAAKIVVTHQQGSASLLQRRLKIGYNRAGRMIDQLESAGIVGPFDGSKARHVLIPDEYNLEQFLSNTEQNEDENPKLEE
ncbi:DNA translocase FtsK 4TM domain-containing protein [Flavobacteriales bacterium AH-315-E23]|nr:DNA translocase FtsK 4TM domain-containing protein [Flavobacteriales bacterium AH-315-E23]